MRCIHGVGRKFAAGRGFVAIARAEDPHLRLCFFESSELVTSHPGWGLPGL